MLTNSQLRLIKTILQQVLDQPEPVANYNEIKNIINDIDNIKWSYIMYLPEGAEIELVANDYQELLQYIDIVIDKIKENTSYYLGCSDQTIIDELKEEEILDESQSN